MIKKIFKTIAIIIGVISIPIVILLGFFIFLSWGSEDSETLFIQKIKDSDLLIVDYDVWYGRDGNTSGITLLKTTNNFDFRDIENTPIVYLQNVSSDKIDGVAFVKPETRELKRKFKNKSMQIDNIEISTTFYKSYTSFGPCMLNKYKFDSFVETNDSLFLFGLEKVFADSKIDSLKIGFKKGNIKIHSDSNGRVYRLEIEEMILVKKGETLKDITDFSGDKNLATACLRTYYMEPDSNIFENEFSDYGFFKELKE